MATILKGAPVVAAMNEANAARCAALAAKGITPTLAVVRVGEREDDLSYERGVMTRCGKVGVAVKQFVLPADATQEQLLRVLDEVNTDDGIHGCLLFRPLPKQFNDRTVRAALAPEKDIDGITDGSLAGVFTNTDLGYAPCTAQACMEILKYYNVPLSGKRAVVVGRSLVVGKPAAMMLDRENATVTLCNSRTRNLPEVCKQADIVVMVAGEEAVLSGEAHCRADLSLPGAQTEMLKALKATGKPVVLVVMAGRPLTISQEVDLADATLFMFHPGTMGGPALAKLLAGEAVPSGKLPMSFPRMAGQEPMYYNYNNSGRPASNIVLMDDIELEAGQTSTGCTGYYLDAGDGPAFPFGYGLSYTTFAYGDVRLSSATMDKTGEIEVACTISNTGKVEASETAQLYVRDLVGSLTRPVRELKGFEKITLKPGESRDVKFTLKASDLAFHTSSETTVVEPGDFQVWVSTDSASGTPVKFTVTE